MHDDSSLTTHHGLRLYRRLLPVIVVIATGMSGCNGDARNESVGGPGSSRSSDVSDMKTYSGESPLQAVAFSPPDAIEFRDGRLSVALDAMPLEQVITEVSRQTGLSIRFVGQMPARKVSKHFSDSALGPGLRRLFDELSTVFVYAGGGDGNSGDKLTALLLLPEGEAVETADMALETGEIASSISTQLQTSIPQSVPLDNGSTSLGDPISDQALYELGETLRQQILKPLRSTD